MRREPVYLGGPSEHTLWGELKSIGLWGVISRRYALSLFLAVFAAPTIWAVLYYGVISSDRYISEAKFIVRGLNGNQVGGLSVLLRTFGISRANEDSYAIQAYVVSRDALRELQRKIDVVGVYTRPEADFLTGYSHLFSSGSFDKFYDYYQDQVILEEDIETGISTLYVSAYRPEDAKAIADQLLLLSEEKVNAMNLRAREDAVQTARATLTSAEARLIEAHRQLTEFRNAQSLVDPTLSASGNFEVIANLLSELAEKEVSLRFVRENSQDNPNIRELESRVRSLKEQIELEKGKIAGSDDALATKLGSYEELVLRRSLAEKEYETAANSLEQARQEAGRKQVYLEAVVRPNLPDKSEEPKRLRYIFTVALLSFSSFVMIYLLVSGSREHLNIH